MAKRVTEDQYALSWLSQNEKERMKALGDGVFQINGRNFFEVDEYAHDGNATFIMHFAGTIPLNSEAQLDEYLGQLRKEILEIYDEEIKRAPGVHIRHEDGRMERFVDYIGDGIEDQKLEEQAHNFDGRKL